MRRVLPAAAAVVLSFAGAALAASTAARIAGGPLTAGTPSHPQGLKLKIGFGWQGFAPGSRPLITRLDLWFPRGSVYNGAKYPRCSALTLDRSGPAGCPKGSIMGSGTGTAFADTTVTRPAITVVNGGPDTVYFYTILNNPARVQEPVVGHITRLHGDFTYHLSATIPPNLRVVAGVPINLTSLEVTAGRGDWLATTNSPAGIMVQTTYQTGATTSYMVWVQDS